MGMYGEKVITDYGRQHGRLNDVVGTVETSPSGNLVLRVGKLLDLEPFSGWEKTGHIVMTPGEAEAFVAEVQAKLAGVEVGSLA